MYYYGNGAGGAYAQHPVQPAWNQSLPMGLKGRPVSSIEEVRAAQIDFDGSLFVFPDVANKVIYTKQINLDGTASLRAYNLVEDTPPAPAYVTKDELADAIENLKRTFNNGKEKENDRTESSSNNATFAF